MTIRKKLWLSLIGIIILAVLAGIVDYPKGPDISIGSYFKELKVHLGLDLRGGIHLVYEADTSLIEAADRGSDLEGVRDSIERRANIFGVSEAVVQTNKVGESWRVIVDLPGVTDVNEAVTLIGATSLLEFKEQQEIGLSDEEKNQIEMTNEAQRIRAEGILAEALKPEADFAVLAQENSEDQGSAANGGDLDFFAQGMMVAEFEDVVFNQLEVGEIYPELVRTQFGFHIIKKIDEREVESEIEGEESTKEARASHILFLTQSLEATVDFVDTGLSGKNLKKSTLQFDQTTGRPIVTLEFDDEGKILFADITERNVSKPLGIYLDGKAIIDTNGDGEIDAWEVYAPIVNEPIKDGKAEISGDFSLEDAKILNKRLNAGALEVPMTLISQQNIGATLGQESIEKSLFAGLLGLILVMIFMIVYYRFPGFIAVMSLTLYTLIVLAIFKLWPITLTLAGIAGFILSIGMAVDANILIFERIKEEMRSGKDQSTAVDDGFARAWPSIRDSNFSSIITSIILVWFGTSLIKGFAIALGIGILVSMFSSMVVTKTFMRLLVRGRMSRLIAWKK